MKYGFPSNNPGVSVDESGIQFLQQADINDPNGPTPFTSPRTSSYVPDTEHNITPIGGIPIPTTLSQISLQADYVEILSSSMSRAVVQSGREDQSIPGTDLSQEQSHLQFGSQILRHHKPQESDSTNQAKNTVGNYPNQIPISKSTVEVSNPDPSQASYDPLAAPEDSGQFSNITCTDLSVNGGNLSSE